MAMDIEVIQRSHDVIAINLDTGQRIGYHDPMGGANRGVLLGEYVQPETREEWLRRVDAL